MKQKNIIKIISIIPAIIIALSVTYLYKTNYANNNFFQFMHTVSDKNYFSYSEAQKEIRKSAQKSFICNIEKPIDSENFLDLLLYFKKSGAKRIIIESNSALISKYNKIDEINNLFSENPELFIETLCWDNAKSLTSHNSDTNINSLFSMRNHFPLSFTAKNQPVPNLLYAKKLHFCPFTQNTGTMQDFLFRLDKKYVITLPFALYAAKYDLKLSDLRFEDGKILINDKTFYYDSQARFAFKKGFIPHKKAEMFSAKDKEKVDISDAFVFITGTNYKYSESGNYKWISTVLGQLQLLEKSDSMIFLPSYISLILSLMMLIIIFFLTIWIKSYLPAFLVLCTCLFGNIILYFFTANFWCLNYPLAGCLLGAISGFICGMITLICFFTLCRFEVFKIFKYSASNSLQRKIAQDITDKKTDLSSKRIKATFIQCKISNLSSNNTDSEEFLIHKNNIANNIENIIQKNDGITNEVLCGYYSEIFSERQYIFNAVNTLKQLNQRAFGKHLTIALHYNNEYFGYTKHIYNKNKSYLEYKPLGNSQNITAKMIRFAEKFGIKNVISASMLKAITDNGDIKLPVRQLDRVKIKNIPFSERLFEVISEEEFKQKESLIGFFHTGLKLFEQQKWKEAAEYFSTCLKIEKTDIPSAIYLQRCKKFIITSPKENWEGIYEID